MKATNKSSKPSDILRRQLPSLSSTVEDAEKLADYIKATGLISSSTVDAIIEETAVRAQRVRRFFAIIHRNMTVDLLGLDPSETLRVLCKEILKKQEQRELDAIANQMLSELSN